MHENPYIPYYSPYAKLISGVHFYLVDLRGSVIIPYESRFVSREV